MIEKNVVKEGNFDIHIYYFEFHMMSENLIKNSTLFIKI